ncbi:MAG: NADH-quinone oxidoreductase subunit NuoE [Dehalococcoidia bacterium]|nr:NADH-quinone oxidoreductase subunit NuoE [Dehalococcoidia bacterium]
MSEESNNLSIILTEDRRSRGGLIDILQDIQAVHGYLSQEAMLDVAKFLDMPAASVWGVATFYNQFRFTPPGKRPIKVCMGTACHLAGGQMVLEAIARELDIKIGGTTPDWEFSLERVACIGCCALAPVVTIGEQAYPHMTPPKIEEVLVTIRPAAPQKEGGASTLP